MTGQRSGRGTLRATTVDGRPVAPYVYTPGDGRRYVWAGGEYIEVQRIDRTGGVLTFHPEDVINVGTGADGTPHARTATAFMATVDRWRVAR